MEMISFRIISGVGTAKSSYIEAIQAAKKGDFEKAEALMEEGQKAYVEGHIAHSEVLQEEAQSGKKTEIDLLFLHAEDQLMSTNTIKVMAEEFIDLYKTLKQQ